MITAGLLSWRNSIDFLIRDNLPLSRWRYREKGLILDDQLAPLQPADQTLVLDLVARYRLEPYLNLLQASSFADNILHLALLDACKEFWPQRAEARTLDIGSKNFCYVIALHGFLRTMVNSLSAPLVLEGIEIDAHRMYRNLYSRKVCARYYTHLVPGSRYIHGDVLKWQPAQEYDVITHFFPFFDQDAVLDWGLAKKHFTPLPILERAYRWLKPQGLYFVGFTHEQEFHYGVSLARSVGFKTLGTCTISLGFAKKPLYAALFVK